MTKKSPKSQIIKDIKKDELGHPVFIAPRLKGRAGDEFDELSFKQEDAYNLIMNVPPINRQDQRYNALFAVRVAKNMTFDRIRKGILVYQQHLERGEKPTSMSAYLKDIFEKGYEPEPPHAAKNRDHWKSVKCTYPEGSYIEARDGVIFTRVEREVTWRMSQETFRHQIKIARDELRDT